jgi:hypothetical protein
LSYMKAASIIAARNTPHSRTSLESPRIAIRGLLFGAKKILKNISLSSRHLTDPCYIDRTKSEQGRAGDSRRVQIAGLASVASSAEGFGFSGAIQSPKSNRRLNKIPGGKGVSHV